MNRTNIYLDEDLASAVKEEAYKTNRTNSAIIRDALREYFFKSKAKISNPIVAAAVAAAKEKDIKFNPVPKPERKHK